MTDFGPAAILDSYLRSNWTTTPIFDGHDLDDLPNPPEPLVVVEHLAGTEVIVGCGAQIFREDGASNFHAFVPATSGWFESDRLARELRALLRAQEISGVQIWETHGPQPHDKAPAGYVASTLTATWSYDVFT